MLKAVAVLVAVALGGVFAFGKIERGLVYPFDTTRVAPQDLGLALREEVFESGGKRLILWVGEARAGKPAVLYFTTDECAQCRLQQAPILAQLQARVDVAVHKLDAIEQEALAQLYGIMTVPTTVVLDTQLRPVAINHGVTPLQKLQAQIGATGGQPPAV